MNLSGQNDLEKKEQLNEEKKKKCIVNLTERKEREKCSQGEEMRYGREILGRDSIMSSNGYFTLP